MTERANIRELFRVGMRYETPRVQPPGRSVLAFLRCSSEGQVYPSCTCCGDRVVLGNLNSQSELHPSAAWGLHVSGFIRKVVRSFSEQTQTN